MDATFNPYRDWLGLPAHLNAPNHYELLGLMPFEEHVERIAQAADRACTRVRACPPGGYSTRWFQLLDEINRARQCLCDPAGKAQYDQQLRQAGMSGLLLPMSGPAQPMMPAPGPGTYYPPGVATSFPQPMAPQPNAWPNPFDQQQPAQPAAFGWPSAPTGFPEQNPAAMPGFTAAPGWPNAFPAPAPAAPGWGMPADFGQPYGQGQMPAAPMQGGFPAPYAPQPTAFPQAMPPQNPFAFPAPAPAEPAPQMWAPAAPAPQPFSAPAPVAPMPAAAPVKVVAAAVAPGMMANLPQGKLVDAPVTPQAEPIANAAPISLAVKPAAAKPKARRTEREQKQMQTVMFFVGGGAALLLLGLVLSYAFSGSGSKNKPHENTSVAQAHSSEHPAKPAPVENVNTTPKSPAKPVKSDPVIMSVAPPIVGEPSEPVSTPAPTPLPETPVTSVVPVVSVPAVEPTVPVKVPEGPIRIPDPVGTKPAMPVETPVVVTPPVSAKPTAEEVATLSKALQAARGSLTTLDFAAADAELAKVESLARLPAHRAKYEHLRSLTDHVRQYRTALDEGRAALKPGQVIRVGGSTDAEIIESTPDKLVLKVNGDKKEYTGGKPLPRGVATAILDTKLDPNDPNSRVIKGAASIAAAQVDQGRTLLQEAQASGAKVDNLLAAVDEKYELSVNDEEASQVVAKPVTPEPTPSPMPSPAPAPSGDVAAQLQAIRVALAAMDLAKANRDLTAVESQINGKEQEDAFQRLKYFADALGQFQSRLDESLGKMQAGDTIRTRDNLEVAVIEVTPTKLSIRAQGKNLSYRRDQMPILLKTSIFNRVADRNDPINKIVKGAYLLATCSDDSNRKQALDWWNEAAAAGQDIKFLFPIADEFKPLAGK